jgi:hypothetical protein
VTIAETADRREPPSHYRTKLPCLGRTRRSEKVPLLELARPPARRRRLPRISPKRSSTGISRNWRESDDHGADVEPRASSHRLSAGGRRLRALGPPPAANSRDTSPVRVVVPTSRFGRPGRRP